MLKGFTQLVVGWWFDVWAPTPEQVAPKPAIDAAPKPPEQPVFEGDPSDVSFADVPWKAAEYVKAGMFKKQSAIRQCQVAGCRCDSGRMPLCPYHEQHAVTPAIIRDIRRVLADPQSTDDQKTALLRSILLDARAFCAAAPNN